MLTGAWRVTIPKIDVAVTAAQRHDAFSESQSGFGHPKCNGKDQMAVDLGAGVSGNVALCRDPGIKDFRGHRCRATMRAFNGTGPERIDRKGSRSQLHVLRRQGAVDMTRSDRGVAEGNRYLVQVADDIADSI